MIDSSLSGVDFTMERIFETPPLTAIDSVPNTNQSLSLLHRFELERQDIPTADWNDAGAGVFDLSTKSGVSQALSTTAAQRKRKAPTLREQDWEPVKARVLELYVDQDQPLPTVRDTVEKELGFSASLRQYRTRVSQWGRDKNVKPNEMKAIVRKRQQRRLVETDKAELGFRVRGTTVEPEKIDRWMRRNGVCADEMYAPSPAASTPGALSVRTILEHAHTDQEAAQELAPQAPAVSLSPEPTDVVTVSSEQSDVADYRCIAPSHDDPFGALSQHEDPIIRDRNPLGLPVSKQEESQCRAQLDALDALSSLGTRLNHECVCREVEEISRILLSQERADGDKLDDFRVDPKLCRGLTSLDLGSDRSKSSLLAEGHHERPPCDIRHKQGYLRCALRAGRQLVYGHRNLGRLGLAERMLLHLCKASESFFDPDHTEARACRWDLAYTYVQQLLATQQRTIETVHPNTLGRIKTLAVICANEGSLEKAEEVFVERARTQERILGVEHPATLLTLDDLGMIYHSRGLWTKAREVLEEVAEMSMMVLPPGDPLTTWRVLDAARIRCLLSIGD